MSPKWLGPPFLTVGGKGMKKEQTHKNMYTE